MPHVVKSAASRFPALLVASIVLGGAPSPAGAEPTPAPASTARPELVPQVGHAKSITSVAFSSDGAFVLTGSDDFTARMWETATGYEVRRFEGHTAGVTSVAFSPDGALVLTGSSDKSARLWDKATGREVRRLDLHDQPVRSVAFSSDGGLVVTGSDDRTARLWETSSGKALRLFQGHAGAVSSVSISRDRTRVLTASSDRTACVWDIAGQRMLRALGPHGAEVKSAAFSPDGTQVVTASFDETLRLWDAARGVEVRRFQTPPPERRHELTSVAFSPDGQQVVAGSYDRTVRLWNVATGAQVWEFRDADPALAVTSVAFSPDPAGARVLVGSEDRIARLLDRAKGTLIRRFEGRTDAVNSVAFSARDGTLDPAGRGAEAMSARILTGSDDKTAHLWDAGTGAEVARLQGHHSEVIAVAFSPDGSRLLTGAGPNVLSGTGSFTSQTGDTTARLWDAASAKVLQRFEGHAKTVLAVAFSADGSRVVTGSYDGSAHLWDAAGGKAIQSFFGHTKCVTSVALSSDGTRLLTGSFDETVRLWDAATGTPVWTYRFPAEGRVTSVAFSPKGDRILAASWDDTARLLDRDGKELRTYAGHTRCVTSVAFSPDGAHIVTASDNQFGFGDGTTRLWDTENSAPVGQLEGRQWGVRSVAFSPNGKHVLTGSADGVSRLYDAATGRRLGSMMSFRDGTWAVIDAEGRYDASAGGDVEGLHWVIGTDVISLDQARDAYYEPGLLAKLLGRNTEPMRDVKAFAALALYPKVVSLEEKDGRLRIDLEDRGGGIGPVVVMLNGKEFTDDARALPGAPAPDPRAKTLHLEVDLSGSRGFLSGETNRIEVFAYNADHTLRGRGVGKQRPPTGARPDTDLWAVIAGVSEYSGSKIDLRFAAKDAVDFHAALSLAATKFFRAEHTHLTLLKDVRREQLIGELKKAEEQAKAGDIFVLYLAGHGVTRGEKFFYLTADATTLDLSEADQTTAAISSGELIDALKLIPATKQVLILDTCASGGLVDAMTGRGEPPSGQTRELNRVKDRMGTFVLAGCGAQDVSYEDPRFRHGLLTYSLLLGMRGQRLKDDQYVDVATLFDFAVGNVRDILRPTGRTQLPRVAQPRAGGSFSIGQMGKEEKEKVPVESEWPVFVAPSLQKEGKGYDEDGLMDRLIERLKNEDAREGSAISYVTASNYPGAYQISGTYATQDGRTKVTFRLIRDRKPVTPDPLEASGSGDELLDRILEAARKATGR